MKILWLAVLLGGCLILSGCVSVHLIPTELPLPERPDIVFRSVPPDICLDEPGANKLLRYFQELDAFRRAWKRLQ